ncbi:MAG: hypothetical protein GF364_10180 [Candidatus Lokiarchaeota archaeon]|nr:hypothetical protein [Candidatus Lokiarchaeota archaeon]
MKKNYLFIFFLISLFTNSILIVNNVQNENLKPLNTLNSSYTSRKISFSGYDWTVRTSQGALQGPGPNLFNDSEDSVWLDTNDYLHLKIRNDSLNWYCAEVYSDLSFGYGTYIFKLASGFENLDINVVVGLFTYLDDEHEIDIEYTRWGDTNLENGQYVCQPYYNAGNKYRYELEETGQASIHAFTWCENYIKFETELGSTYNGEDNQQISSWFYTGDDIPEPSTERVHMNLWLFQGNAPTDETACEVIIKEFSFMPSDCDDKIPWHISSSSISIIVIFSICAISYLYIRLKQKTKIY